jgi:hypothetical protein
LKQEALDRTLWRTRFGRGYGPVVRQTTEWMQHKVNKATLSIDSLLCGRSVYYLSIRMTEMWPQHYGPVLNIKFDTNGSCLNLNITSSTSEDR